MGWRKTSRAFPISTTLPAYITPDEVCDLRNHGQIARDEDHGQGEFFAQLGQQIQHLGLDGDSPAAEALGYASRVAAHRTLA